MSQPLPGPEFRRALEASLRFAAASGAWIVAGPPEPTDTPQAPVADASNAGVAASRPPLLTPGAEAALSAIREDLGDCRRCRLSQTRTQIVFGVGAPGARLVFVGEAPGAEEDRKGEPFVGRAGKLLDRMLRALGMERSEVYIANVVKCRPPGNRDPREDEADTCMPFLWRQIEALQPLAVCALGAQAARNLLGSDAPVGSLRGRPQNARGWTVLPTYHPAYLLRNPSAKRLAWQDLKVLQSLLHHDPPSESRRLGGGAAPALPDARTTGRLAPPTG